jgi:hypothetical protein
MALATASVTPPASAVPGQASHQEVPAEQMRATAYDQGTGEITISYAPACDALNHTVYWGDLASVSTYGYTGAECNVGTSGSAVFNPGPGSAFFLIAGNDGANEGSYGEDSGSVQRPEHSGTAGCDYPQDLGGVVCE